MVSPESLSALKVRTARPAALEVSLVSKRRTTSLIISLVLSFAVFAPQAALGYRGSETAAVSSAAPPAPARVEAETNAEASEETVEAADSQPDKPRGNAFARALAAPFRALARLFGGGRKSETAKKSAPPRKQGPEAPKGTVEVSQTARVDPTIQDGAVSEPIEEPKVEPVTSRTRWTPEAPQVQTAPAAAPTPEGVRIVRPPAGEA